MNKLIISMAILIGLSGCAGINSKSSSDQSTTKLTIELLQIIGRTGNGPGQFINPQGIAVSTDDEKGHIYLSDTGNQRIQVLTLNGDFRFQFGRFGVGDGQFNEPQGLYFDGGILYVADQNNHRIQQFDWRGNYAQSIGYLGSEKGAFNRPVDVMKDSYNNVYVVDQGNDRIQRFDGQGNAAYEYGGFGTGYGFLNKPTSVVSLFGGKFLVLDSKNKRIQKFNEEGDFIAAYNLDKSINVKEPQGMTVDGKGNIYIADSGNDRVVILNKKGNLLRTISAPAMKNPSDVAIDSQNNLYVVDFGNNRILKYHVRSSE